MDGFWLISACLAAGGLIGFSGGVLGIGGVAAATSSEPVPVRYGAELALL